MVKIPNQQELLAYLQEALTSIRQIKDIGSRKNKTLKIRAVLSMLTIIEARIEASHKFVKAGGIDSFPLSFQQDMYNPIIEWLAKELE